uniref:Ubiquitin-like protease family profile domain-containing protein n=1 Tax=Spongospora subterranea TaxID=70186 RepID=A0A0H5R802_9EUKA|eukprot:CRZ09857.1 hypothetical protein [Spongospora subterranea]
MGSMQSDRRGDAHSSNADFVDPFEQNDDAGSDILEQAIHGKMPSNSFHRFKTKKTTKPKFTPIPSKRPKTTDLSFSLPPASLREHSFKKQHSTPVVGSSQTQKDSTALFSRAFGIPPMRFDKIPKLSDNEAPFSQRTHECDRQEFGRGKVAEEYLSLDNRTPKARSLSLVEQPGYTLDQMPRRTSAVTTFAQNSETWKVKSSFSTSTNTPRKRETSTFFSNKTPVQSSTESPPKPKLVNPAPVKTSISAAKPVKRVPRKGASLDDPVEISDDETEEHDPWGVIRDRIRVGQIWLGDCCLVGHGPSEFVFDTLKWKNKNIIVKFTPYICEQVPHGHIIRSVLYVKGSGRGSTFLSLLIDEQHSFGAWSRHYTSLSDQAGPVWITVFVGDGPYISELSKLAAELPNFEQLIDPELHIQNVRPVKDVSPCSASRLDSVSKDRRMEVKDSEILKYPPDGKYSVRISNGDIESLDPGEFLNDTIIDFKLAEIRHRHNNPRFHVFTSFFYKRFVTSKQSYDSVKRWADKEDLFSKDYWLIPINEMLHWTLAVVCNPNSSDSSAEPVMLYFDSLGLSGARAFGVIKNYVAAALSSGRRRLKCHDSILTIEKNFKFLDVDVPRQSNSFDCGIYLLLFADLFMSEPPNLSSPHMPNWFGRSLADAHRAVVRGDILKLSYEQDDAHPGPICTEYCPETPPASVLSAADNSAEISIDPD